MQLDKCYSTWEDEIPAMAWKTYAWGMLLLAVITFVGRVGFHLKRPGSTTYWDLFQAVFNFIMMPALFGFVYHRAYFFRL